MRTTCRLKWRRACASSTPRRRPRRRRRREPQRQELIAMAAELGHFALILAFCLALPQAFFGLVGAAYRRPHWMTLTTRAVAGQFVFTAFAFACLAYSFYWNDFSVLYVAQNSNSELPTFYRFAAVWGAHEGSLLLWPVSYTHLTLPTSDL